jgi:hypothetical protein
MNERVEFYDPNKAAQITETAIEITKTLYGRLAQHIPYEQLEDLLAHDLLAVTEDIPVLIFLDVDGVLNSYKSLEVAHEETSYTDLDGLLLASFDERCVERLKKVLDKVPDAKIVVSSVWRFGSNFEVLKKKLGEYSERIIGVTRRADHGFRGMEVEDYLLTHYRKKKVRMAIVDDESDFFPHQSPFHVHCDMEYGLSETNAYQLYYKLLHSERIIP